MTLRNAAKYFVHGLLLTLFFFAWPIGWYPVFLLTLFLGISGLAFSLILLVFVLGFFNNIISSYLWFPVRLSLGRILIQGTMITAMLLILYVFFSSWDVVISRFIALSPSPLLFETAKIAIETVAGAFIIGFIGSKVAVWKPRHKEMPKTIEPLNSTRPKDRKGAKSG